ncbi:DNA repair protein RAD51 homolog 4 [Tetranychus urticae]|uniref:RecA family profile 1 domain-containing protein n=1 Tax=Tetranychus urticae TaxID=32264 RepID=T1KGN2_TETUR|nr:DNA repair protein RAD51 homolog 4 [Tetranychus urticae]
MSLLRFNRIIDFNQSELDTLIVSGISTIQTFLVKEASAISKTTSIDIKKIKTNQTKLYEYYSTPLVNLSSLFKETSEKRYVYTTGCPRLDEMIDGGIFSGEITSIMGQSCSGKTQFVHHMALQMAIQGKEVIYIDTDGSFSAERLAQMYDETLPELDKESVLQKVIVTQIFGLYKLLSLLDRLTEELKTPEGPYNDVKMIILDSYTNPFVDVLDYQKDWDRAKRQSLLTIISAYNRALRTIVMLRPDIAFITTNIVIEFAKCLWNNNCGLVLSLDKTDHEVRDISCVQSERVTHANQSCRVKITKSGFIDCQEDNNVSDQMVIV